MYTLEHLDNGLDLLRIPVGGVESVTSMVMVQTGSRYESEKDYGVAHFLEHMVFKGTKKYPTNKILTQTVDSIGAEFNAFTSEESTAFYLRAAAKDLDLTLDVLSQLTTQMLLDPEEIDRERGVILEEKHMYEDQPNAYNDQEFNKMVFAGSGLGHDVVGTDKSITEMKRENFVQFVDKWYHPRNMLVVIAGKQSAVKAKDLAARVVEYFGKMRPDSGARQIDNWKKKFVYGRKLNIIDRDTEQTHFVLAWPCLNRFDERDYISGVLQTILGGNMSSRLFSEVRERRGLCYYVYAQEERFCDAGLFGAASGVNPQKLTEALKVTINEFQALASGEKPVTADELQRAKDYRCGQIALAAEGVFNVAANYGGQQLFKKKIETVAEQVKKIQSVTTDQMLALAQECFREGELRLGVIGKLTAQQKKDVKALVD